MKKDDNHRSFLTKNKALLNRITPFLFIAIIIITFFKTYNIAYDKKINLGGDNVYYFILGTSLATGHGYTNILNKEMRPHNHYPVGYPLIIAATLKLSPYSIKNKENNIQLVKKINGFFLLLSMLLLFLILKKLSGNYFIPFITGLFLLVNYHILYYSVIMMSEIPFLFFSTLVLFLFLNTDFSKPLKKNFNFIVLVLILTFTYYLRSTGLALVAGLAIFLLFKRNWKYLIILSGSFTLFILPWYIRTKKLGGNPYMKQLIQKNPYRPEMGQMEFFDWFKRIWNNIERYVTREIPSGLFGYVHNYKTIDPVSISEWLIGIAIVLIIIYGLTRLKKYGLLVFTYLLSFFGILMLWPEAWFGVRFVLPLLPLLAFLFIYGISEFLVLLTSKFNYHNKPVIYIIITLISLVSINIYAKRPLEKLHKKSIGFYDKRYVRYFEMAKYVRDHKPDTSITACRKGELFYIVSGKYVTGYKSSSDPVEQIAFLKSKNVDYVVLDRLGFSSTQRYLLPAINAFPLKFKEVKHLEDPDTYLFKFRPDYGYNGDFVNGKKEGFGTIVYENGHRYEGTWKNNKREGYGKYYWTNGQWFEGEWKNEWRNGKGILHLTDSSSFEGTWTNDTLNGLVILKSKEGKIVQKSIYKKNVRVGFIKQKN